tara:strand:- start:1160 stop:1711 length:552 start_codon:yes stop_codon:yes gene_type:complete
VRRENLFSKFKLSLDSIWEVVEVASVAAMEVAVEVIDNKHQRRRVKIIIKFSVSKETLLIKKFIKSSKKWQLNIIQIKIKMTQKQLRPNSKRLLMRMKHLAIKKREKFMMFMEKRVYNKMNNKKDHIKVEEVSIKISTLMISLEEEVDSTVVVVVEEAIILEVVIHSVATSNRFTKTYLKIQM